jgi:hypothetical protein
MVRDGSAGLETGRAVWRSFGWGICVGLNTKGRRGVPADPLLSNRASYQGMRPVGGRPDQRR